MINIEKEFIATMIAKHPQSESCLYDLIQHSAISYDRMKYYLIRKRWDELVDERGVQFQKMIAYADISEEFGMTPESVRRVVNFYRD